MHDVENTVAAVDLGSNSFHMVVARIVHGQPVQIDKLRERVALAAGLDHEKRLSEEAQQRALSCLQRFGERLVDIPPDLVRTVATSTFRRAQASTEFVRAAEEALGHSIDIIEGDEEARLIYLGVAHDYADGPERRLVIDIGGGSTECIVGENYEVLKTNSFHLGCVNQSKRFFPDGRITAKAFEKAAVHAGLSFRPVRRIYRDLGWEEAIGSSGTVIAIEKLSRALELTPWGITRESLRRLEEILIERGHSKDLELPGLQPDRREVLAGGLSILSSCFDAFELERLKASTSALREGVIYDLVGRIKHEDVRDHTIHHLARRYHVDERHASRVRRTAFRLFDQVALQWNLRDPKDKQVLGWAAEIHEIGVSISYSGHHKHGAYVLANTSLPGFARSEQQKLAAMVLGHRRKFSRERTEALYCNANTRMLRLIAVLRLAVLLNRSRSPKDPPEVVLEAEDRRLTLRLPEGWLSRHPMTSADLDVEAARLGEVGIELSAE